MADAVIAIDLGGTRMRLGVAPIADPAAVVGKAEWAAPADREAFLGLIRTALAEHGASRLGIGVPGLTEGTRCRWVPNLPWLDGLDLAEALPGVSIGLGNDAQLALLAEFSAGAARDIDDAILLAIGTGIGSAVLAGGRIVTGSAGGACSFGWATADVEDTGEDVSGWLERQASGRALDRAAQGVGMTDGSALVAAARTGSLPALHALALPMRSLGTALAGAVGLLDPRAIILAGGVANATDVLAPLILKPLRRQLPPHLRDIELRPGSFGSRAGLVGAAFAGALGPTWKDGGKRRNG